MTDSTVVGNGSVGTIEHIIVVVHRKGGGAPSWCCGMTGSTIGRYAQSPVVRIVGSYIGNYDNRCMYGGITITTVMTHSAIIGYNSMSSC